MTADTPQATDAPKPKGRQIYKMRVGEIRDHTSRIRELFLKFEECDGPIRFQFRAGQFVMLHVPAQPKPALRAYSIASSDERHDGFRLIFNHIENGLASNFVRSLKGGELLEFTGPFGRLFFKEPPLKQIVMLSTGSGISQHVCYLESNLKKYRDLRYRVLMGMRTESDIYYRSELAILKREFKDFDYEFVLSRAGDSWTGKKGYVQYFLQEFNYKETPTTFYLCGNGAMIKDVKAHLTADGFDSTQILAEAFD
jgi:ferredoxin-NADP reductase